MSTKNRKVRVWGRFRPTSNFAKENIEILGDGKTVNVHLRKDPKKGVVNNQILDWSFKLDGFFNNVDQDFVYNTVAADIVSGSIDGYNGTLMCYGQTGAGKTFTMTGATESYQHRGLIPRAISQLFRQIEDRLEYSNTVRVSYLEIYNEGMFDLLGNMPEAAWNSNKDPFTSPEHMVVTENQDGVFVKGLSCHLAQNEEEALNLLFEGETNRSIAAHQLNKQSSRSHCIFTIYLESRSRTQSNAKYTVSKVNFVDLAGSERLSKSKSEGKTKEEALYINKSLSFLEQVVIALASRNRDHVPFRQSKLTHYLKDSIGGNCNTLLVANMWAEKAQLEETVSTLRFATRMMCVASEPCVNEVYDPALLVKKLQREIQHLKSELTMHDTLTNRSLISYDPLSEQQKYEIKSQVRRFLSGELDELDTINLQQILGTYNSFKDLYRELEKEVEARIREKFVLLNKADPQSIVMAQQALENLNAEKKKKEGVPSDGNLKFEAGMTVADDSSGVGDLEGSSFGVGSATRASKADQSSVIQLKKRERERKKISVAGSPVLSGKRSSSPAQSNKGERKAESPGGEKLDASKDFETTASPVSSAENLYRAEKIQKQKTEEAHFKSDESDREEEEEEKIKTRPDTPPSRTSAFEDFKMDRGSEINRILIENKGILASKKKEYSDLANQINNIKHSIDEARGKLEQLKLMREADGPVLNEDGDIIISEDEFLEIQRLKDLKIDYRTRYDELHKLKTEVVYCQKLVDQCRLKLIQEFDNWYSESFLGQADEHPTSFNVGLGTKPGIAMPITSLALEDEQEKFEHLQYEMLMSNPDSAAYYNAKMKTAKRKVFGISMGQQPSSYSRQPGTPTMSIRNKPPNMLQVQY